MSTRLGVNLHESVAVVLRYWCSHHGISITEGVRRAIAVWNFIESERAAGRKLAVIDGDHIREIELAS